MIGHVQKPTRGHDSLIFRGKDEETLAEGVGHLYGKTLPLAGEENQSVLKAHTRFVDADSFTH